MEKIILNNTKLARAFSFKWAAMNAVDITLGVLIWYGTHWIVFLGIPIGKWIGVVGLLICWVTGGALLLQTVYLALVAWSTTRNGIIFGKSWAATQKLQRMLRLNTGSNEFGSRADYEIQEANRAVKRSYCVVTATRFAITVRLPSVAVQNHYLSDDVLKSVAERMNPIGYRTVGKWKETSDGKYKTLLFQASSRP